MTTPRKDTAYEHDVLDPLQAEWRRIQEQKNRGNNGIVTSRKGGMSQLSQRHNVPLNGRKTAIPHIAVVTSGKASVTITNAAVLAKVAFPPVEWIVQQVMPEGLSMLAGKPKTGKSFLAYNIALAVATGGMAMGKIPTKQGRVLYVNLDSGDREFGGRVSRSEVHPEMLEMAFEWPKLDKEGLDLMYAYVSERPDIRLIVVDTFAKVAPAQDTKRSLYAQDYESLDGLAQLARSVHGLAVLVIHHANKLRDVEDPFDSISGSTGLTAAFDTGMVLRRIPEGNALYVKGKEVKQQNIALSWDDRLQTWIYEGDADAYSLDSTWQSVLDAVEAGQTSPRDVADFTGIDYNNIRQAMVRMAAAGKLVRSGRGSYRIPLKPTF